jgi:hypothetical protein
LKLPATHRALKLFLFHLATVMPRSENVKFAVKNGRFWRAEGRDVPRAEQQAGVVVVGSEQIE